LNYCHEAASSNIFNGMNEIYKEFTTNSEKSFYKSSFKNAIKYLIEALLK
jgi:hypothetical protein